MKNRRRELRINTEIELFINEIVIQDGNIVHLPKPIAGTVLNISSVGMLFKTRLDIPKNLDFCLNLSVENNIIPITAKIVRKELQEDCYLYGCEFVLLAECDKQIIRRFVYKEQIKANRKSKQ